MDDEIAKRTAAMLREQSKHSSRLGGLLQFLADKLLRTMVGPRDGDHSGLQVRAVSGSDARITMEIKVNDRVGDCEVGDVSTTCTFLPSPFSPTLSAYDGKALSG